VLIFIFSFVWLFCFTASLLHGAVARRFRRTVATLSLAAGHVILKHLIVLNYTGILGLLNSLGFLLFPSQVISTAVQGYLEKLDLCGTGVGAGVSYWRESSGGLRG